MTDGGIGDLAPATDGNDGIDGVSDLPGGDGPTSVGHADGASTDGTDTPVTYRTDSGACLDGSYLTACVSSCGESRSSEPTAARCVNGVYSCDGGKLPAAGCASSDWPTWQGGVGCGPWVDGYDCGLTCAQCLGGFWTCVECPDAGVDDP